MLRSLYLHHFRNYEEAFFEFSPRFNLLCGSNAQGKTSVLEAIHLLMMGRSFRSNQNAELIKDGAQAFYIEANFAQHGVDQSLKISFDGQDRKIIYNHTPLNSISSLLGIIPGVVMTPDDVGLIKGAPFLRRQFLDLQLAQVDPLYVHHLTRYTRAIRQRNQLLKAKQTLTIESWEHEMSHSAAYLCMQRHKTIHMLKSYCQPIYQALTAEKEHLGIEYKTTLPSHLSLKEIQEYQLDQFRRHRPRELIFGYTLVGPHKDDLLLTIDGKDVRHFGSEGQQRSYVTTLRFAEWRHLNQVGNGSPIIMLDDVGLGLDDHRKNNLRELLATAGQVFLTTTNENLLDQLSVEKKTFHIRKGTIAT